MRVWSFDLAVPPCLACSHFGGTSCDNGPPDRAILNAYVCRVCQLVWCGSKIDWLERVKCRSDYVLSITATRVAPDLEL